MTTVLGEGVTTLFYTDAKFACLAKFHFLFLIVVCPPLSLTHTACPPNGAPVQSLDVARGIPYSKVTRVSPKVIFPTFHISFRGCAIFSSGTRTTISLTAADSASSTVRTRATAASAATPGTCTRGNTRRREGSTRTGSLQRHTDRHGCCTVLLLTAIRHKSILLLQGSVIPVVVDITANHQGHFIFKLCPNNDIFRDPDQTCFDRMPLIAGLDSDQVKYPITDYVTGLRMLYVR